MRSRFAEKAGEPETKKGGREGNSKGRVVAGKGGGGRSSKAESLPGAPRTHPALLGLRDTEGRSYDK